MNANEPKVIRTHAMEKYEALSNTADTKSCHLVTSHGLLDTSRNLLVAPHLLC